VINEQDLLSDTYKYNPIAMSHLLIKNIPDYLAGKNQLLEATSPVTLLIEMAASLATASMSEALNISRRLYPSLAVEDNDIYRHMSDKDYFDIFSTPATASFILLLPRDEVINRSVIDSSGIRHFVIPRNTQVRVNGLDFSFLYPIDIRTMQHGGLQVAFDITKPSPFQNIERDIIDYRLSTISTQTFIEIPIELQQLTIDSYTSSLQESTRLSETYSFTNKYYAARVYFRKTDGTWEEVKTTHSDQVFNPDIPTALLRVTDAQLRVSIPYVYLKTGLVNREMRVDIYTTQGKIDVDLGIFAPQDYGIRWYDLDSDTTLARYSAGLNTISEAAIYSRDKVDGGKDGLTFSQIKRRAITNGATPSLPITEYHIDAMLSDRGYKIIRLIDNITSRMYLATRAISPPKSGDTVTGAGAQVAPLLATLDELLSHPMATIVGDRVTLRPNILYQEGSDGKLKIVPYQETLGLLSLPADVKSSRVNSTKYYYTPWHYVLDFSQNRLEARAYYLNNPGVISRTALRANTKLSVTISVGTVNIDTYDDHFIMDIETSSGAQFKAFNDEDIVVQLSFLANGEDRRGYMLGDLLSIDPETGERTYRFVLNTPFNVNDNGLLSFTNFKQIDSISLRTLWTNLTSNFELTFIVLNQNTPEAADVELQNSVATFMLEEDTTDYLALVKEGFDIKFGASLDDLWIKARSMVRPDQYETYPDDVPQMYERDVYKLKSDGYIDLRVNEVSGLVEGIILHHAGEPMLNNAGEPIMKHKKGDPVLTNGVPTIRNPRTVEHLLSPMLIDGRYYFATDADTMQYKVDYEDKLVEWISGDIAYFGTQLIEKTLIRFYPQKTIGTIEVYNESGNVVAIPSEQKLYIQLTVPKRVEDNIDLRKIITDRTVAVIDSEFNKTTISLSGIISSLTSVLGADAYGISISGLTLGTFTIKDGGSRPTIGKKLTITPEGTLAVRDDVSIEFIKHLG
jgi:hypothetical protein